MRMRIQESRVVDDEYREILGNAAEQALSAHRENSRLWMQNNETLFQAVSEMSREDNDKKDKRDEKDTSCHPLHEYHTHRHVESAVKAVIHLQDTIKRYLQRSLSKNTLEPEFRDIILHNPDRFIFLLELTFLYHDFKNIRMDNGKPSGQYHSAFAEERVAEEFENGLFVQDQRLSEEDKKLMAMLVRFTVPTFNPAEIQKMGSVERIVEYIDQCAAASMPAEAQKEENRGAYISSVLEDVAGLCWEWVSEAVEEPITEPSVTRAINLKLSHFTLSGMIQFAQNRAEVFFPASFLWGASEEVKELRAFVPDKIRRSEIPVDLSLFWNSKMSEPGMLALVTRFSKTPREKWFAAELEERKILF